MRDSEDRWYEEELLVPNRRRLQQFQELRILRLSPAGASNCLEWGWTLLGLRALQLLPQSWLVFL